MLNGHLKKTIIFALVISLIDGLWLKNFMKGRYQILFKSLNLKLKGHIPSIFLAYSTMILAYPLLVLSHTQSNQQLLRSASLGFVIYGVYGFTLSAILPKYDISLAIMEAIWGTFLYSVSHKLTEYIYNKI